MSAAPLLTVAMLTEHDIVLARQRARQIAALLGFEKHEQTRIATAVSEIARNAARYARAGKVEYFLEPDPERAFLVRISDKGRGIPDLPAVLEGRYRSRTGMGVGISASRRLVDRFEIATSRESGTTVTLGKTLPPGPAFTPERIAKLAEDLSRRAPESALEEVQQQNQELLGALERLQQQSSELTNLNRELENTNRGVVALYAELDDRADYLQRANEVKNRFLSNMTHELRTPLTSVLGLSRILLDRLDGPLTAEQEKQIGFIRRSAEELLEIVNDLLDLAKVESGRIAVQPSSFTVAELFGALRGMLKPLLFTNAKVELVFEDPVQMPELYTDLQKVSQILRNFISNALKHTDEGEVRVSAAALDDLVVFTVCDTGIGIAPENHERIFEEFTQLESPRGQTGTGLGLPLSRKLATLLGGAITVKSALGKGATFSVSVPVRYLAAQPASQEVDAAPDPLRLPLLVVEDSPGSSFVYDRYLGGNGFQVIAARSEAQARRLIDRVRPLAVLFDVTQPGEGSWDLLADLKRGAKTRGLPAIAISVKDNEARALASGADAFHVRPVSRAWLLDRLGTLAWPDGKHREVALVVDDSEVARYLLNGLLESTLYRVSEASTGAEALRRAAEELPDVILLDLKLADKSGYDVLRRLREEPATRLIPVIIHTSSPIDEVRRRIGSEVAAVLSKETLSGSAAADALRLALLSARGAKETLRG